MSGELEPHRHEEPVRADVAVGEYAGVEAGGYGEGAADHAAGGRGGPAPEPAVDPVDEGEEVLDVAGGRGDADRPGQVDELIGVAADGSSVPGVPAPGKRMKYGRTRRSSADLAGGSAGVSATPGSPFMGPIWPT